MAMFRYNPKQEKKNLESTDGNWTAQTALVVTNKGTGEKYIVDGFENRTGYEFDKEDLWYSFDYEKNYNFHIVPSRMEQGTEEMPLAMKLKRILDEVGGKEISGITVAKKVSVGVAKDGCTTNHKYFCAYSEKKQYLMSFNRLWCDVRTDGNHIYNNFGQAQFMCFPRELNNLGEDVGNINRFPDGKFKMMYPNSAEDEVRTKDAGHRVYNAPYNIRSDTKEIAGCFVKFIKQCENEDKKGANE